MNNPKRISSGIDINTLRSEINTYLKEENTKHSIRARNTGRKSCQRCGFCCLKQPCVPAPNEFASIADYLNITTRELASKYTVVNVDNGAFYLLWARETQTDLLGKPLPYFRTYDRGYCTFFDEKSHGCKIHEVRPKSAKVTKCWKRKPDKYEPHWTIDEIRTVLPDFDPYIAALQISDNAMAGSLHR